MHFQHNLCCYLCVWIFFLLGRFLKTPCVSLLKEYTEPKERYFLFSSFLSYFKVILEHLDQHHHLLVIKSCIRRCRSLQWMSWMLGGKIIFRPNCDIVKYFAMFGHITICMEQKKPKTSWGWAVPSSDQLKLTAN